MTIKKCLQFSYICTFLLLLSGTAQAIPITVDFTAAGFAVSNSNAAPTDPVTGQIVYDAVDISSSIDSIISIDLTLNGYTFGVSEVGFQDLGTWHLIGGILSNPTGIVNMSNDFWLRFTKGTLQGFDFNYASSTLSGIWSTQNFSSFTVTSGTPVSEPHLLVALGFFAVLALRVLRRKTPHRNT